MSTMTVGAVEASNRAGMRALLAAKAAAAGSFFTNTAVPAVVSVTSAVRDTVAGWLVDVLGVERAARWSNTLRYGWLGARASIQSHPRAWMMAAAGWAVRNKTVRSIASKLAAPFRLIGKLAYSGIVRAEVALRVDKPVTVIERARTAVADTSFRVRVAATKVVSSAARFTTRHLTSPGSIGRLVFTTTTHGASLYALSTFALTALTTPVMPVALGIVAIPALYVAGKAAAYDVVCDAMDTYSRYNGKEKVEEAAWAVKAAAKHGEEQIKVAENGAPTPATMAKGQPTPNRASRRAGKQAARKSQPATAGGR